MLGCVTPVQPVYSAVEDLNVPILASTSPRDLLVFRTAGLLAIELTGDAKLEPAFTSGFGPADQSVRLQRGFLRNLSWSRVGGRTRISIVVSTQPRVFWSNHHLVISALERVHSDAFEFRNTPLREAIDKVTWREDHHYLLAPGPRPKVSGCYEGLEPGAVLEALVRPLGLEVRALDRFLAIGTAEQVDSLDPGLTREAQLRRLGLQEILLEHADADQLLLVLRRQFRNVVFVRHPTMNGYYVAGSRRDVLRLKNEIPHLDFEPSPMRSVPIKP